MDLASLGLVPAGQQQPKPAVPSLASLGLVPVNQNPSAPFANQPTMDLPGNQAGWMPNVMADSPLKMGADQDVVNFLGGYDPGPLRPDDALTYDGQQLPLNAITPSVIENSSKHEAARIQENRGATLPYSTEDWNQLGGFVGKGIDDLPEYDGSMPLARRMKPKANEAFAGIKQARGLSDEEILDRLAAGTDTDLEENGGDESFRKSLRGYRNYRSTSGGKNKDAQAKSAEMAKKLGPKAREVWERALDNQERFEYLKQAVREEIDAKEGLVWEDVGGSASARVASQAGLDAGTVAASAYYRLTGQEGKSDDLNLAKLAYDEVINEIAPGKMESYARGVGSSLFQGLLFARAGSTIASGAPKLGATVGTMAGYGQGARDQAYAQSGMTTLTEKERRTYAGRQAAIEAGVMGAFALGSQALGIQTLESMLGGKQQIQSLAKGFGTFLSEMTEESATTLLQDLNSKVSGLTPDNASVGPQMVDTWVQTALTMGLVEGSQRVLDFVNDPLKYSKPLGLDFYTDDELEDLADSVKLNAPADYGPDLEMEGAEEAEFEIKPTGQDQAGADFAKQAWEDVTGQPTGPAQPATEPVAEPPSPEPAPAAEAPQAAPQGPKKPPAKKPVLDTGAGGFMQDGIAYQIAHTDNGYVFKRTQNGITTTKGGDPRGGGWSYEEAAAKMKAEYDFDRQTPKEPKSELPKPKAPQAAPKAKGEVSGTTVPAVNYGTAEKPNRTALGKVYGDILESGGKFRTIVEARQKAASLIGKDPAHIAAGIDKEVDRKSVDEAVEIGVVQATRKIIKEGKDTGQTFDDLVDLYKRQPRLTVRTAQSAVDQAFSTPAPLAYVAQVLAGVDRGKKAFDSSAGNGMLLTAVPDPKNDAYAVELDDDRVASLASQGINVTKGDASEIVEGKKYESIIINPPFGRVPAAAGGFKRWNHKGYRTDKVDHAITLATLQTLADNGKAVIIIGAKGYRKSAPLADMERASAYSEAKGFYDRVYDQYNVTDHFTVDGKLYERQGASFPVDVIVVDGKGKSSRPKPWEFQKGGLPQPINSWEELKNAKLTNQGAGSVTSAGSVDSVQPGEGTAVVPPDAGPAGKPPGVAGKRSPRPASGNRPSVRGEDRERTGVQQPRPSSPSPVVSGGAKQPGADPKQVPDDAGADRPGGRGGVDAGGAAEGDPLEAAIAAEFERQEAAEKPAAPAKKKPAAKTKPTPSQPENRPVSFTRRLYQHLYQGRGATPEEVYGKDAVEQGRAVPLFGPGQYYAFRPEDAKNYGDDVKKHIVELENPLLIDSDKQWRELLAKADAQHLDNKDRKFYTDPAGIPAATQRLQDYIKSLGHDGVEIRTVYARDLEAMAGHDQVIVFAPTEAPTKKKPAAKKKPAPKPETVDALEQAKAEAAAALKALLDGFKAPPGSTATSGGIDPAHVTRAVTLARAVTKVGILEFKAFVEYVNAAAPDMMDQLAPYLEAAWAYLHKHDKTGKIDPAGKVADILAPAKPKVEKAKDAETEFQVTYTPGSKNEAVGTLLPKNHVAAVRRALEKIQDTYGDIDEFVREELGFTKKQFDNAFSAEQVDALAMAIHNDKIGEAFIIGDQTGVGKGRIVAAMMQYAIKKGLVPVFVTEKPSLYADMMRDITALGMNPEENPFTPLITNALGGNDKIDLNNQLTDRGPRVVSQGSDVAKRMFKEGVESLLADGVMKSKYNRKDRTHQAIFTTYSQLNPVKGSETWRHSELRKVLPKAYLILDESHNAGAAPEEDGWSDDDKITRAEIVREFVQSAGNVFYSSATFAKRPDLMDLYSRAGIGRAVEDVSKLPELMKDGGVPLQQVLSEMLVEAGLYLRRERSYDGVKFEPKVAKVNLETADVAATAFRAINDFSNAMAESVGEVEKQIVGSGGKRGKDSATGNAGVVNTNFSSILWNVTSQMLFALKADAAATEAIASWKAGKTPVIVVDETMESKLDDFVEANGIAYGDLADYSFKDLLHSYLERSREILIKKDKEDPESWYRHRLTDDELGEVALSYYDAALEEIEKFDAELPSSPIDWIRHRLQEAGMSVTEITGRESMLDYSSGMNTPTLAKRPGEEQGNSGKAATVKGINDGSIDAVILNRSGSTGLSLHAHKDFKNQKTRHMIIAQPAKNIDEFMQMLGRVHRTGQTKTPEYTLFMSDAPAETRPAAVLTKKLGSLNANVTASAKGSVGFDVPDVINELGDRIVGQWISENRDKNAQMGFPVRETDKGGLDMPENVAQKVSGRVALLPVAEQQAFWDEVVDAFNQLVEELNATNSNPLVASTLDLAAKTVEKFAITEAKDAGSDDPFRQPAYLETVSVKRTEKPMSAKQVADLVRKVYPEGSIGDSARAWSREKYEALRTKTIEFVGDREKQIRERKQGKNEKDQDFADKTESMVKSVNDTASATFSQVGEVLRNYAPGTVVRLNINKEPMVGVIVGVDGKSSGGNPSAPSKWTIDIALADSLRRLRIPVTRFFHDDTQVENKGLLTPETFEQGPYGKAFDDLQSHSREQRYMITGNLLSGFAAAEGNIVFYSNDEGEYGRGILMPRNFNVAKWQEERPVIFKTPEKLLQFLQAGGHASTTDGNLIIAHYGDNLVIRAPYANSKSGKYVKNPDIIKAGNGHQFETKSGKKVWELTVPPGREQAAVLKAIMGVQSIQTKSDKDLARSLGNDYASMMEGLPKAKPWRNKQNPTRQTRSTTAKGRDDTSKETIAAQDIIKTLERIFNVPLRSGGYNGRAAGRYYIKPEVVRRREDHIAGLGVAMHEIGHHIDKKTGIGDKDITPLNDTLKNELAGLDYDNKGRLFEGWAEFVRMYVTEQNAQVRAPQFYKYFTKTWLKENPEWAKPLEEARKYCRQFADQSVFLRLQSLIGGQGRDLDYYEDFKNRAKTRYRRILASQVDRYEALQFVSDKLKEQGRRTLDPYEVAMRYSLTSAAESEAALDNGVHNLRTGERYGGPGLWSAKQYVYNREEEAEAISYAQARHTLWYRKNVNENYNSSMDPADALYWTNWVEKNGKKDRYDAFADTIAEYGNDLLRMQADAGVITRDEAEKLIKLYGNNYFPLLREQAKDKSPVFAGSGFANLPAPLRRRSQKGSGARILDPFEAMMAKTQLAYSRAAKARVMNVLIQALDPSRGGAEGFGRFLMKVDPKLKPTFGIVKDVLSDLVHEGLIDPMDARAALVANKLLETGRISYQGRLLLCQRAGLDPLKATDDQVEQAARQEPDVLSQISIWRPDFKANAGKHTVLHIDPSGQKVLYELDELLYRVVAAVDERAMGEVMKTLKIGSEIFKLGAIGLNTAFAGRNAVRDYISFQGRSEHVKGLRTLTEPGKMLATYLWAKSVGQATGTKNALVELFDETGGRVYTQLGSIRGQKRLRRQALSKDPVKSRLLNAVKMPGVTAIRGIQGLQNVLESITAISDIPPRLAAMNAVIKAHGYTYEGGIWFDESSGTAVPVKGLPEHVRIKAANAAANATVNYKRSGTMAAEREVFAALSRAQINAIYRHFELIGNLKNIAKKGDKGDLAKRYFIYNAALAALSAMGWALRADDDDYREMDETTRNQYWSVRILGQTFLVPKPQDEAIVANVTEGLLDMIYKDDAPNLGRTIRNDLVGRIPTGGGVLRGALETWGNYDTFRDRDIVPYWVRKRPEAFQYDNYTTMASRTVGEYTGPYLGLGPMEAEHLLNSASGGVWRRWTNYYDEVERDIENGTADSLKLKNVPYIGWVVPNPNQARSVNDFYRHMEEIQLQADTDTYNGKKNTEAQQQAEQLAGYAEVMTAIREMEPKDSAGRRGYKYQQYIVGLAREAMGREPLESNPNPFTAKEIPDDIKKAVQEVAEGHVNAAILSHGRPQGDSKEGPLDERLEAWNANVAYATKWLNDHKDSPAVRESINNVLGTKKFLEAKFQRFPSFPSIKATQNAGWGGDRNGYFDYLQQAREADIKRAEDMENLFSGG